MGWEPRPGTVRDLGEALFERMPEENARRLLEDSQIHLPSLFALLRPVYQPATVTALTRWVALFLSVHPGSDALQTLGWFQQGEEVLRGCPDTAPEYRQQLFDRLRPLRDAAASDPRQGEAVHRAWLGLCHLRAGEAQRYLLALLRRAQQVPPGWADGALEATLADPASDYRGVLAETAGVPQAVVCERLRRVLKLVGLVVRLEREWSIGTAAPLEQGHLAAVRQVFMPWRDAEAGDMAAELLGHLCQHKATGTLATMLQHAGALTDARRFSEARQRLAQAREQFGWTLRGLLQAGRLWACRGKARTAPPGVADYRRVIARLTRDWLCCQGSAVRGVRPRE
jgi:hypothetical protein